jgi:hydroxymethylpyrimidine pyrophosphatase-like HAD family hydrolase
MIEAFFDIDGSLIDESCEFNAPVKKLSSLVRELSGEVRFNINSNRSLKNILSIWEKIGFNGVIVYENGLGVFNPKNGRKELETGKGIDKEKIRNILSEEGERVSFINTDELIRNPKKFIAQPGMPIYCEQTREYTATIYPRIIFNNIPVPDSEYLSYIAGKIVNAFGDPYNIDISSKYFNITLTPKDASKGNPMRNMKIGKIASFGDSTQDIEMFRESTAGLVGCPANADLEVKDFVEKRKGFIATFPHTSGAIEFIREVFKK